MRYLLTVLGAVLLVAGCGENPVGNRDIEIPDVDIRVALDWPAVREYDLVDARWAAYTAGWGSEYKEWASGEFDATGKALVEYTVGCRQGDITGVGIEVWGRYPGWAADQECYVIIHETQCTPELQNITVQITPEANEWCQPPID